MLPSLMLPMRTSADGIGGAQQRGTLVLVVLLGVQQVLDAHGTGDAAHIHVGVDGAAVDAVLDLAVGLGSDEVFRLILVDGLAARVADLFHGIQHQVGHDADLWRSAARILSVSWLLAVRMVLLMSSILSLMALTASKRESLVLVSSARDEAP